MTNPPVPPIVPLGGDAWDDGKDDDEPYGDGPFVNDSRPADLDFDADEDDRPVDPDLDADQVDSADADLRATTAGTKDGVGDR
jgi:hypothetical protein